MIVVAVGVLVLTVLVAVGRFPWIASSWGRLIGFAAMALAGAAVIYDAARGGWLGASILLSAMLTLGLSARRGPGKAATGMQRSHAASMLGVPENANSAAVEAAYRRLIVRVHPDHGGASGLAAELNAARATMLRRKP